MDSYHEKVDTWSCEQLAHIIEVVSKATINGEKINQIVLVWVHHHQQHEYLHNDS